AKMCSLAQGESIRNARTRHTPGNKRLRLIYSSSYQLNYNPGGNKHQASNRKNYHALSRYCRNGEPF
ncbi:MAG: hypothetical protein V1932_06860, partial [Chloroflexota bacterium]